MPKFTLFMLVVACSISGCNCTTVQPGNVGVAVTMGQLEEWTYPEGFHFTGPLTDVHMLSTRTETYTMAGNGTEATVEGSINVVTSDQLSVVMDVSVQYHLNGSSAVLVYRYFGEDYARTLVHPIVRTAVRDAASEFSAIQLVDHRPQLQQRMEAMVSETLRTTLQGRGVDARAIVVDNILVRNIDLPQSLEESIANVQRQHQQTVQSVEALSTARAEAERLVMQANGEAQARLSRARAEAESNRIINESLTPEVLRARQIDAISAMLANEHTRTVLLPVGTTPLLSLGDTP